MTKHSVQRIQMRAIEPWGGGALSIMDNTEKLRSKGVTFSDWRYAKGRDFTISSIEKGWENWHLRTTRDFQNILNRNT